MSEARFDLFGVPVDPLDAQALVDLVAAACHGRERRTIAHLNLHGLYCALQNPPMLALLRQPNTCVHVDGMSVIWLARLRGVRIARDRRITHIDLLPQILRALADDGRRVMFVGSTADAHAAGAAGLERLAPGLQLRCVSGQFDLHDEGPQSTQRRILDEIAAWAPDFVLVGMGMPRQEHWILRWRDQIEAPAVMTCGGFFDYFSGRARQPPRWLGPLGLEWAYRLLSDPIRLGRRYCWEPLALMWLLARARRRAQP